MSEQTLEIIKSLIVTGVPALVTIITYISQTRRSKKHAAKQSILQMIMEDQLSWELFKKFPVNYGNIQDEYEIYHKNGGNGEVTKKVHEYNQWYKENEDLMHKMKNYSCKANVVTSCEIISDEPQTNNDLKGGHNGEKLNHS